MSVDSKRLMQALRKAGIHDRFGISSAAIILAVHGLDSAVNYASGLQQVREGRYVGATLGEERQGISNSGPGGIERDGI